MADHVLAYLRRVMTWHASRSDDFRSPIVRGMARTRPSQRRRQRVLSDEEISAVWRAAEASPSAFGYLVQFLLLTATRRTEAAAMRRSEVVGNEWIIPQERYKTGLELVIPLSPAAQSRACRRAEDRQERFRVHDRWQASARRLFQVQASFRHQGARRTAQGEPRRRTAALDAARSAAHGAVVDVPRRRAQRSCRTLPGARSAGIRGTYDRHEYLPEKRRAFEALASLIARIVNPADNVVALSDGRAKSHPAPA